MDRFQHPNPRVHKQLLSHNSKRIIKFLLSLSIFCALVSLLPFLLQSSKQFFTTDKSYMFLLCNGLLVFVRLINNFSSTQSTRHQSIELEVAVDHEKSNGLEQFTAPEIPVTIAGENEDDVEIEFQQRAEENNSLMIVAVEQGHEEEGINACAEDIDEEDLDEHGAGDTEELNKKCEDFIRKMRAAFCSEPKEISGALQF